MLQLLGKLQKTRLVLLCTRRCFSHSYRSPQRWRLWLFIRPIIRRCITLIGWSRETSNCPRFAFTSNLGQILYAKGLTLCFFFATQLRIQHIIHNLKIMDYKSADFVLDVLVSRTRDKVRHWEYCINVHKKLEPHDKLGIAHMEGICSAHRHTLNMLEFHKKTL